MTPQESSRQINALLYLERQPVGITFLSLKEDYDAYYAKEGRNKISYCTAVRKAGQEEILKMHIGHQACSGGAMALGFIKPGEDTTSGRRRYKNGCYDSLGTSRRVTSGMIYCAHTPYGVGIAPLKACRHERPPDVVIVVCSPYNAMRLLHGHAHYHGFAEGMRTAGLQAVCHDCTSFPYETGRMNVSALCPGTRMLAGWEREEMAIGIPWQLWPDVVSGVKRTVNPFERDTDKTRIAAELSKNELVRVDIEMGKNYDDGCYIGGLADAPPEENQ